MDKLNSESLIRMDKWILILKLYLCMSIHHESAIRKLMFPDYYIVVTHNRYTSSPITKRNGMAY